MLEKAKKCTSQVEPGAEHVVFKPLGALRSGADLGKPMSRTERYLMLLLGQRYCIIPASFSSLGPRP